MLPKVSVLWLNYNSMHLIDVTKQSLAAIAEIDYTDFEVVVVDNASSDGSKERIAQLLEDGILGKRKFKFLPLKQNMGYAGGMNAAYNAKDSRSKYVSLLHNDIIAKHSYLRELITYMEAHPDTGAVQGVTVKLDNESLVDSDGYLLDEGLAHLLRSKNTPVSKVKRGRYVSFVEGTMPVYSVPLIQEVLKSKENLFVSAGFIHYLEDVFLSLMFWNSGYKCVVLPFITASHYRLAIINKFVTPTSLSYYSSRNRIALLSMTNSSEKPRVLIQHLRRIAVGRGNVTQKKMMIKSLVEGLALGRQLRQRYGTIDLHKVPLVPVRPLKRFRF